MKIKRVLQKFFAALFKNYVIFKSRDRSARQCLRSVVYSHHWVPLKCPEPGQNQSINQKSLLKRLVHWHPQPEGPHSLVHHHRSTRPDKFSRVEVLPVRKSPKQQIDCLGQPSTVPEPEGAHPCALEKLLPFQGEVFAEVLR